MDTSDPPIAIVGGGPAGMALALALAVRGCRAQIFDERARGAAMQDQRVIALSHGSRQILDWLGVWPRVEAASIATIHVSQQGSLGRARFSAADAGVPALGYVTTAASLGRALDEAIARTQVPFRENERVERVEELGDQSQTLRLVTTSGYAQARLVAYADGGLTAGPGMTERNYGQHALICHVTAHARHDNVAYERFTATGSFALLPLVGSGREFALVYVCRSADVEAIVAEDDATFLARLQTEVGARHRFVASTKRHAYALALRYRDSPRGKRTVWLGNAAQTLHPIAGQGFNLALRDIWELARALEGAEDPGAQPILNRYAVRRRTDRMGAIGFTDGLIRLFADDRPLLRHARGLGLLALDLLPPARAFFARRMMYGARAWM